MKEYTITIQVTYEAYIMVEADSAEEAREEAITESSDPATLSNHTYNVTEEPKIIEIEVGGA